MLLSLIVTSCKDEEEKPVVEKPTTEKPVVEESPDVGETGPVVEVEVETDKPQYGGTLNVVTGSDITVWNPGAVTAQSADGIGGWVLEQILGMDFTKGPAGTGETNYIGGVEDYRYLAGNIAESFETPEIGVWVLNIRQDIYWANHPDQEASKLVNGRKMTAEDVAYSLEYSRDNNTMSRIFEPELLTNMTVERSGEWQLIVRTPKAPTTGYLWLMGGGGVQYVWPKEFLDTYGTSNNWYDVVGCGPYIIDDYVTGSAMKLIRNENYWDTNPIGPGQGDKLPYIDAVNYQIVPDYSSRLALLRTGQADWSLIDTLQKEDFDTIKKSNPDIKYAQTIIAPQQVAGNINLDTPFAKKEVRQAMMLAIDHPTIVADFYDGQAELLDSPARKWYRSIYTPLEEQNETVQALYGYDPDRAKELLTNAGYPTGFKMNVQMQNAPASEEAFAIMKEYWSKVGIDVEGIVLEPTVFSSVWTGRKYDDDLILSALPGGDGSLFVRYSMGYFRGPNAFNLSCVNDPPGTDPVIENAYDVQCANVMINYPAADAVTKETWKYVLEQAFLIPMPAPWGYRIWQPWVKNYYGAGAVKFWLRWAWIDQDLKQSMTGN
jgi:ABC-type transport system substrate-binding protein